MDLIHKENAEKIVKLRRQILDLILKSKLGPIEMIVLIQNVTIPILSAYQKCSPLTTLEEILEKYSLDLKDGILQKDLGKIN